MIKNSDRNECRSGIIIKAVGGLYTIESLDGIYECKARGIFRKHNISPMVGDNILFTDENVITDILPRKNFIIRPPLANLDQLIFVVSMCKPSPNLVLLDKFIAVAEYKNITPVVVLTKTDLDSFDNIYNIYSSIGIKTIPVDYSNPDTLREVSEILRDKISAFTGNTGAGKSTLLNAVDSSLNIPTGEISEKLGRGRHTTRHASLYKLREGGYIADTPGFSTFETGKYDVIRKDDLSCCFREFAQYADKCRFRDCSHTKEKGCMVIDAVEKGLIARSRHDSYIEMYEEARLIKEWEL